MQCPDTYEIWIQGPQGKPWRWSNRHYRNPHDAETALDSVKAHIQISEPAGRLHGATARLFKVTREEVTE